MSAWDDFNRLSVLKVEFLQNSAAKNAIIYGNGNNQVAVVLHATVLGKDNQPLSIPQNELLEATHLINYTTGEKLNWKGTVYNNSPWEYSDADKGYSNPVNYGSAVQEPQENKTEGAFTIIYYISSSQLSSGLDVAAGINVPGVGEFNTTADGTSTKNSPGGATGSVFKSPSFVHVSAIEPINYNNGNKIQVIKDSDVIISDRMHYTSRILATSYQHDNGTVKRTIVRLKSDLEHPFLTHSITYTPIKYEDCNTGWDDHFEIGGMNAFSNDDTHGKPCAVIGEAISGSSYNVYIWYSRPNKVGFGAGWLSERWEAGRYYKCRFLNTSLPDEDHTQDDESGEATLLLYTFICPEHNKDNLWWNNTRRNPDVHVIDIYGNEGKFKLAFDNGNVGFV